MDYIIFAYENEIVSKYWSKGSNLIVAFQTKRGKTKRKIIIVEVVELEVR